MKRFFEVFEELELSGEAEGLLQDVLIRRITFSRDRSLLRIYIESPHLIEKERVREAEQAIRRQLFPGKRIEVRIMERSVHIPRSLQPLFQLHSLGAKGL